MLVVVVSSESSGVVAILRVALIHCGAIDPAIILVSMHPNLNP